MKAYQLSRRDKKAPLLIEDIGAQINLRRAERQIELIVAICHLIVVSIWLAIFGYSIARKTRRIPTTQTRGNKSLLPLTPALYNPDHLKHLHIGELDGRSKSCGHIRHISNDGAYLSGRRGTYQHGDPERASPEPQGSGSETRERPFTDGIELRAAIDQNRKHRDSGAYSDRHIEENARSGRVSVDAGASQEGCLMTRKLWLLSIGILLIMVGCLAVPYSVILWLSSQ